MRNKTTEEKFEDMHYRILALERQIGELTNFQYIVQEGEKVVISGVPVHYEETFGREYRTIHMHKLLKMLLNHLGLKIEYKKESVELKESK